MTRIIAYAVVCATLGLSGCQALSDVAAVLPPAPQPESYQQLQCEDGGGHWRPITTYDANGNAQYGGECIGHPEWNQAPVIVQPRVAPSVVHKAAPKPTPHAAPAPKKASAPPQKDEDKSP